MEVPVSDAANQLPLLGKSVLVTRAAEQSAAFTAALTVLGARVVAVPTIAIVPPPDESVIRAAVSSLDTFRWVILTSVNAVDRFYTYLADSGITRLPDTLGVAAVGPATAASLAARGVAPAFVPADYRAEGLIEEFDRLGPVTDSSQPVRVLFPRALKAREILPAHLRKLGYEVVVAPAYETVAATLSAEQTRDIESGVDALTFTSPSTARYFFAGCHEAGIDPLQLASRSAIFSIGPVTTDELVGLGVPRDQVIEAPSSTTAEMVRIVRDHLSAG